MKKKNIQRILSGYFIRITLLLLLVVSLLFSVVQYRTLRENSIQNLRHHCASIADNVDQQIIQMNRISLSTISSSATRTAFSRYETAALSAYERNLLRQELAGALTTAKGFDFSVRQLNLYGFQEGGYGVGGYNGDLPASCREQAWYEDTVAAEGKLYIAPPAPDVILSEAAGIDPEREYLSACRVFYDSYHTPIGIVEVKRFYSDVFRMAQQPGDSLPVTVTIRNPDGRLLFPLDAAVSEEEVSPEEPEQEGDRVNPVTGQREYVTFAVSEGNHLVVSTAISQREFLAPVYRSLFWLLLVLLGLLLLCLPVAFLLSRRFSTPIKEIYHFLSDETRDRFAPIDLADTGVRELDKLRDSLNESIRAQKAGTETMMILKEQEVQTQMLALQSQMNPHFLYNSLSTIAEMAEEGLTQPVADMCREITEIFRYISSNREQRIGLEEELELCDMYLNCIRMRFGEDLQYSFDVEDEMLEFLIPKLCIQLLVENAIKSATTQSPPWRIRIEGRIHEKDWSVTVKDNGPGFDPEVDRHLRGQMDEILEKGILPSLKIEGMGILNIFIRLYLLDGIPFIFDFGNLPEGGAFVTVGGIRRETDEKDRSLSHPAGG